VVWAILILLALIAVNAVLAMSELAVMTSRHSRLAQAAGRGDKGAAKALALAREPTRFLSTVQVGITVIGIFAGAFGEKSLSDPLEKVLDNAPVIAPYADTIALILVVVGITYFSLVLGELVPKRLALAHPEAVARVIALPLDLLSRIAAVPVKALTLSTEGVLALFRIRQSNTQEVSEDDVKAIMSRAASTGVFDPHEHDLLKRVFRVRELRARDLMVPRADVLWIDRSWSVTDIRVLVGTSPYSHYPVCKGGLDQVEGVVHIKDLISYGLLESGSFDVTTVARAPLFVPEATPVLKLLEAFQARRTHMALVVDEYGAVEGLLTLNDVLRTLVGEIPRAGEDDPASIVTRADGTLLVDGAFPLHEFITRLAIPDEAAADVRAVSTVGGLMLALLGRVPDRGDSIRWQNLRLEVIDMDRQRVDQVLVTRLTPPPPEGPGSSPEPGDRA
jgi:putative hemolysin